MSQSLPDSLHFDALRAAYAEGLDPCAMVDGVAARISLYDDAALFLSRPDAAALDARATALARLDAGARARLPLFGIPFAVKDNIDVAGLPTTAACPAFAYTPTRSATTVERLEAAGAIVIGKTNLDQFATGLVGVRSPYGVPRNTFDAAIIPGGSSSGSATSVAAGLVSFSLGTDTAGSGRVPAGLNNLVGLKPTPGLASTRGVVPACRTLDCVSIFALTTADAFDALAVMGGYDADDPFCRPMPIGAMGARPAAVRLGVPMDKDRLFFGDDLAEAEYRHAIATLERAGAHLVPVDMEPLFAIARLLYEGPWVAERYIAAQAMMDLEPDPLLPVIRRIVGGAPQRTAIEAFNAHYKLKAAERDCEALWSSVDALLVPTVPRAWTLAEVEAEPIATNSALGTYTNFVNLLGMAALAVPLAMRPDGLPAGVTLIAKGGRDAWLASVGQWVETLGAMPLGATGHARPEPTPRTAATPAGYEPVAVFGAHMSGLPLNKDLLAFGGVFVDTTKTSTDYRFYALAGGPPYRPGLLRVDAGGAAIDAEIWALPPEGLGRLLSTVPQPLCIGTVELSDGRRIKGFLCEPSGLSGAADITSFGGWRHYLAN